MATKQEPSEYEEDFTPKTANRKISKRMLILIASVVVLVGLGIAGYFIYQGSIYYKTDNAKVDTMIYQLNAETSGMLEKIYVSQGEKVSSRQVLAKVEKGPLLRSPIDGTVIDIVMTEGDYVTPANVVMIVAKTSDIYITANVEETNILRIHAGQNAIVSLDAYGRSFDGYVDDVNMVTSTKLSNSMTSFTTSGTYTKVTQLIPIKIKLREDIDLYDIIGTNATVKIRIK
jgi:multidrug resistance efflux pump